MSELERLKADIAALPSGLNTREVYEETCALMFFRYGITPTANKLHSAVGRGSMSTPVEVLRQFWDKLRQKSRVRIEGADLPEELVSAGGELLGTLWRQARAAAEAALSTREAALQEKEAAYAAQLQAAQSEKEKLETALAHRTENLLNTQVRLQEREAELSASQARTAELDLQLSELNDAVRVSDEMRNLAERQFAQRLEALALAGQEAEARAAASEKRALLEIDRERTRSARLQKELEAIRVTAQESLEKATERETSLRQKLDAAQQRVVAAETAAAVQDAGRTALEREVVSLRSEVVDLRVKLASTQADLSAAREATTGDVLVSSAALPGTSSKRAEPRRRRAKTHRTG